MVILRPDGDPAAFLARLRAARTRVLVSDFDGTLAPFVDDRRAARPWPGVAEALGRLAARDGTRIVVVSGRPADEVVACLGMPEPPEAWGVHGRERRLPDGTTRVAPVPAASRRALATARTAARDRGWEGLLEEKAGALALHWRGLPASRSTRLRREVLRAWAGPCQGGRLVPVPFDGGIELRVPGIDKGHALRTLLQEAGPGAAVAYLGDDRTDEDAFGAMEGAGLAVLVRGRRRPTRASLWLRPPAELLEFLWGWALAADPAGRSP